MNIKKGLVIILGIAVLLAGLFALTACNGKKTDETTTVAPETTTVAETTETNQKTTAAKSEKTTTVTNQVETPKASEETTSGKIVGSWKNSDYGSDYIYTFKADGTGKYDAAGTVMEFTYTTKGNTLSILYTGNTAPFETKFSVKGNTLNVIDSIGNDTLYKKVK